MNDRHKWIGTISGIIGIIAFATGISSLPQFREWLERKHVKDKPHQSSSQTAPAPSTQIFKRKPKPEPITTYSPPSQSPPEEEPADRATADWSRSKGANEPAVHQVNFGAQYDAPLINTIGLSISGDFIPVNIYGITTIRAIFSTASGTPLFNPQGGPLVTQTSTMVTENATPVGFRLGMPYYYLPEGDLSYNLLIDYDGQRLYISDPQFFRMSGSYP